MPEITVAEIARRTGGEVVGDPEVALRGVAGLATAGPHDVSFVTHVRYLPALGASGAGAVLVPRALATGVPFSIPAIRVDDPYIVLSWLIPLLHPEPTEAPGIHATAIVSPGASIGEGVRIEAYAVISEGAEIGDRVRVGSHSVVGEGCRVGIDSVIHPHVTLAGGSIVGQRCIIHGGARIGGEGAGSVTPEGDRGRNRRIGSCRIGDDVEIGANTTIDRGAFEDTVVGDGTKIDNLVQIAPNVRIGRRVLVAAQAGVAGNSTIEDGAVLAGQVGIIGNLTIGRGARVGGGSVVSGDVPAGSTVSGHPARPHRETMKAHAALARLPQMFRRLQELERLVRRGGDGPPAESP